ncbi:hypothetical protein [Roseimaritima multifibrata]|nr:hypothetical protein [Roseimaritima multifibrata]
MVAILYLGIMFVYVPWNERQRRRRLEKRRERYERLMALGDEEDPLATVPSASSPLRSSTPKARPKPADSGNPYQPPDDQAE